MHYAFLNLKSLTIRTAKRKHELIINNKIRFFYPDISITNQINTDEINELIKKKNSIQKSKAIAEVLKAFHVEPIPIKAISYSDFYDQLINRELIN